MKLLKKLSLALFVAATIGTASAQTTVYVAGSTAFRASATAAIFSYLTNNTTGTFKFSSDGSNVYKAGHAIIQSNDGTIIFKTAWTGSLAGVVDLALRNNVDFLSTTAPSNTNAPAVAPAGNVHAALSTTSPDVNDAEPPDFVMSDSFVGSVETILKQSPTIASGLKSGSTTFTTGAQIASFIANANITNGGNTTTPVPNGVGVDAATAQAVGIVPFEFLLGNTSNAPASSPTNITAHIAAALIQGPVAEPQIVGGNNGSFITGNAGTGFTETTTTSEGDFYYLIGRNEDSGTRIDSFAVAFGGFLAPPTGQSIQQYALTFTTATPTDGTTNAGTKIETGGAGNTVTGGQPFPLTALNTEPKITFGPAGHSGYISGGDVVNVLSATNPSTESISGAPGEAVNSYFIGYVGLADASTGTGTKPLMFGGVSPKAETIENGSYTLWSLEHLYYLGTGNANALTGTKMTLADSIAALIFDTYACTNNGGVYASAQTPAAQDAITTDQGSTVTPNVPATPGPATTPVGDTGAFNGAGIFYDDGNTLFSVSADGGAYGLLY